MAVKLSRAERCRAGRHTPLPNLRTKDGDVDRGICRYCRNPIMRTQATRIWFLATTLAIVPAAPATVAPAIITAASALPARATQEA